MSSAPAAGRYLRSPRELPSDERPLSVYDNLTAMFPAHTSTPVKSASPPRTTATAQSPYVDISFRFDDLAQRTPHPHDVHNPAPSATRNTFQNNLPPTNYHAENLSPARPSSNSNNTRLDTGNLSNRYPFSTSYTSQPSGHESIAAVKAALSDAKSRFFGLNNNNNNNNDELDNCKRLLPTSPNDNKVQIVPVAAPKPQPKYQNIPANSAIFRSNNNTNNSSSSNTSEIPSKAPRSPRSSSPSLSERNFRTTFHPLRDHSTSPQRLLGNSRRHTKSIPNGMDFGVNSQPSQAVYMTTTVPQNIKGSNIAGRHTPTRNSLRHSRMLVINKNYQAPKPPNPLNLRHPTVAKTFLILEIVLGILITFVGFWILLWAPHTRLQDNPYWSGLSLLFAGILGLVLLRCRRIKRHKVRENCFVFVKWDSYLLALVASLLCLIAFTCAAIHLSRLSASDTKCTSANILVANAACICVFNFKESANGTAATISTHGSEDGSYSFQYRDLSCTEVDGGWKFILALSMFLNLLGFLFTSLYLILLLCCRQDPKGYYSNVQTNQY